MTNYAKYYERNKQDAELQHKGGRDRFYLYPPFRYVAQGTSLQEEVVGQGSEGEKPAR